MSRPSVILIIFAFLISFSLQNFRKENNFNFNSKVSQVNSEGVDNSQNSDILENLNNLEFDINFDSDTLPDDDEHRHHGAKTLFVAGFLRGLGIFQNVTHKNECLSILPVLHDDGADIYNRIKNITDYREMVQAAKYIVAKIEHSEKKIMESRPDCRAMFQDIRTLMMRVRKHFTGKEKIEMVYTHLFQNLGVVIQKWENAKEHCRMHHFYRSGCATGDMMKFVLFWDFPRKDEIKELTLFEDFNFNKPPFKFE